MNISGKILIILAGLSIAILGLRLFVVLVNVILRHWLKRGKQDDGEFVSVLIPARNEERNIELILQDLLNLDYPGMEVIVYDDSSEDRTAEIVSEFQQKDSRIKLVKGIELPDGWMGKNHACYQLAKHARGVKLLFLDADVRVNKGLVRDSLYHMKKYKLSLVSIFPRQRMETFAELLTVPLMNLILVGLLPMPLIRRSKRPSLAAANGQFMLFDGDIYRKHQFHSMVKNRNVEDIHISRIMKSMGYRIDTLLSAGQVECRMYTGYQEAINGFSRSVLAFFGGSNIALILYIIFTTVGFLFVGLGISWMAALVYIGGVIFMKTLAAFTSRQPVIWNILFIPLQQVAMIHITIEAFRKKIRRTSSWKGRTINFQGK